MLSHGITGEFYIPPAVDMVAVILFAITGALSAARRGYDWVGTVTIALVTGCGGGLLRDVLLNIRPALLEHETYLAAVVAAVFLSTYFCGLLAKLHWIFPAADALGLAMYAVIGTQKSLEQGLGILAAVLIGTLSAIGGGLIRDVLTREEANLLKPGQWQALIALGTSIIFSLLSRLTDIPSAFSGIFIVLLAVSARFLAMRFDIKTRPLKPVGFEHSPWQ